MNPNILIDNFDTIYDVVIFISRLVGILMVVMGIFKLKRYGEMRTHMSTQITILSPLLPILVGLGLFSFPSLLAGSLETLWGYSNPLAYPGGSGGYQAYMRPIILFIRIIGMAAIIRGLILLTRAGGSQSQPGMMGKALVHFIGGILAFNIVGTVNLIRAILNI